MILKEICPDCGTHLEMKRACCEDRAKGWLLAKVCTECGVSKRWDPKDLFGGNNEGHIENNSSTTPDRHKTL